MREGWGFKAIRIFLHFLAILPLLLHCAPYCTAVADRAETELRSPRLEKSKLELLLSQQRGRASYIHSCFILLSDQYFVSFPLSLPLSLSLSLSDLRVVLWSTFFP